jgi:hypothetical protein
MKKIEDLKLLYDKVMVFLTNTEYGEYLAMKELFGELVATRVAMRGEMRVPPFINNQQKMEAEEGDL